MFFSRHQSSSQDSAASSLTAEKTPQWQEHNPTPDRGHPKAIPSSNRRKRLVRQFSLWVHILCDYCVGGRSSSLLLREWALTEVLKNYHCSLKTTVCSELGAGRVSHSVCFNLLHISNHEDEDDLPEALAAISSECTGKAGSSSSLDKQIQPSIYPQVTHTHTQTKLTWRYVMYSLVP